MEQLKALGVLDRLKAAFVFFTHLFMQVSERLMLRAQFAKVAFQRCSAWCASPSPPTGHACASMSLQVDTHQPNWWREPQPLVETFEELQLMLQLQVKHTLVQPYLGECTSLLLPDSTERQSLHHSSHDRSLCCLMRRLMLSAPSALLWSMIFITGG
jgi:hypothetical protein